MLWGGGRTFEPWEPLALALRWEPREKGERNARSEGCRLVSVHTQPGAAPDFLRHSPDGDAREERREGAGGLGALGGSPFSGTPRGAASQWDLHTRGVTALLC